MTPKETIEETWKRILIEKQLYKNVNRVEVIQHSEPYNGRAYTNVKV